MQTLALVSGLIGALISAGLSYVIRASLDKRALKLAESRVAYVHLVQISQLVAMEVIITSYVRAFVGKDAESALASPDQSFEPSHKVSVILAEALRELTPEKRKQTPGLSLAPLYLRAQLETFADAKLSADQLSKLPREAVVTYSIFLDQLAHLRGVLLIWIDYFESEAASWITPESVHDQWLALKRFSELARSLRKALVAAGAATADEANKLLDEQIATYKKQLLSKLESQPKILAAVKSNAESKPSEEA